MKSSSSKKSKSEYSKAQRHETPPAESMSIPSGKRERLLPLVDVGSKQFEHLCSDVLRSQFPGVTRANLKRKSGQSQFGVDVEGFDEMHRPFVVVSCKCYRKIDTWEVREWIEDFLKHLDGHWAGKGVKHFVLALTVEFSVDDLNDATKKLAAMLAERDIAFTIWDTNELSGLLRKEVAYVDRYFNDVWVKAISADVPDGAPSQATSAPFAMQDILGGHGVLSHIESLYTQPLSDVNAKALERCVAELRKGRRSSFQEWFEAARSNLFGWAGISQDVRAKGLRIAAMIALTDGLIENCKVLLDEADSLQHAPDRTARAMLLRAMDGLPAALFYITAPVDRREREVLAAFLIESRAHAQALETLVPLVGQDATSEVLRLRAIARMLSGGKRKEALNLANSSVAKEPDSAMAILTRGQIHVASSLANGVAPQFGSVPNPISRSLVLPTSEARSQLALAVKDFEQVWSNVEGEFQREVEVWRLAALLLNPETRSQARDLSRALLARRDLEPAAVVWCLQYGLPMKKGAIRKQLVDTLRQDKGTPGHVAVLALMSSTLAEPEKGLAVIDRFAPLFPEATEFLGHWRSQFAIGEGDISSNYSAAVRAAILTNDFAPLMMFLNSDVATVENVLSGAEALASKNAFEEVNRLRELLTSTGTARGVELAAISALNTGNPKAAKILLDRARLAGMEDTSRLKRVRLNTYEALGNHQELIDELEAALTRKDDPQLRDQLLNAYLRIGALDRVKIHTEIVIRSGEVDEQKAIRLAYALRTFSPETAKLALGTVRRDKVPDNLAGALLSLSSHLGLSELQDEMLRKLITSPDGDRVLRRFDTIEEVMAVLEGSAAEHRKLIEEWLYGRLPAAGAMGSDAKDYAMLFLASPRTRKGRLGDQIPMMLRAGLQPRNPIEDVGDRPILRLDMGALLIAHRLNLIEHLERRFELEIPESLPEALIETSAALQDISRPAAAAVRSIHGGESAVIVMKEPDTPAFEIITLKEGITGAEKSALAYAADRAYMDGHLTRVQVQKLYENLEIAETDRRTPVESLLFSGGALIDLVHLDLLSAIARGFPLHVRETEIDRLMGQVETAEDEDRVKTRLLALSTVVAEKLSSSRWKTIVVDEERGEKDQAAKLSPHARCLIETLPRGGEPSGILFWIEDRVFSRQMLPIGMDLPMILSHLTKAGDLTKDEAAAIARELRRTGYLFLPIDADEIADVIEHAMILAGQVVENDEIADVRRWFARDILHLKYLDQAPQIDADGMITGEARRVLDLGHLLTDLLDRIWRSDVSTVEQKFARSSWIWSNLRLDYVPSPPAADVPEARRYIATVNAMQILTLPIRADLGSATLSEEWRQPFIDWAMSTIIRPMTAADPEAGEEIANLTASMISRTLEVPADPDEDLMKLLGNHMIAIVGAFLDLLPHEWDSRIAGRKNIRAALKREVILLLDLDTDFQVAVRDISSAISRCRASGTNQTDLKLHPNGLPATLVLSDDSQGRPAATIKTDEREIPIHLSTMALVSPEADVRERLLLSLPKDGNVGRPITREFLIEIAHEPDAERRVDRFHERLKADFARSREAMWQRVSLDGSIQLKDFALPEPAEILNFLGLSGDFRGGGQELIAASTPVLKAQIGIERAVSRLCSIPVRLPDDVLREFSEVTDQHQEEWPTDFESLPLSFARLLGLVSSGRGVFEPDARLLQNITKDRARLFLTVLRHSAKQGIHSDVWSCLPSELALCLIWVHADQLTRNLCVEGLDIPQLLQWLADKTPSRILDHERERKWDDWVIDCLTGLSANRFLGVVIAELLRHGVSLPGSFKDLIGHEGSQGWMPLPEVLVPRQQAPPEYWIALDPVSALVEADWLPADNPFAAREPSELLARILSETDKEDPSLLASMIALFIDVERIDVQSLEGLRERLNEIAAANSIAQTGPGYGALADVVAKVYRRQEDELGFTEWVKTSAELNRTSWPHRLVRLDDTDDCGKAAIALFNACYVFAWSGEASLTGRIDTLTSLLKTISDTWPRSNLAVVSCLDGLARQVDIPTAAKGLLPSLLALRAR